MPDSSAPDALPWSDHFAVGHETIDRQHRVLVESINEIAAAVRTQDAGGVARLIESLRAAAVEHFREENAVLWQIKTGTYNRRSTKALPRPSYDLLSDTVFEEHTADHKSLLTRIEEIASAPMHAIVDELKAWFVDHAVAHDAHLKAIFQAIS
jgi:hemerythrin